MQHILFSSGTVKLGDDINSHAPPHPALSGQLPEEPVWNVRDMPAVPRQPGEGASQSLIYREAVRRFEGDTCSVMARPKIHSRRRKRTCWPLRTFLALPTAYRELALQQPHIYEACCQARIGSPIYAWVSLSFLLCG
jgi:hypothetical protein